MTQVAKELLLKDLCARLPYRTKIHIIGEGDGEEIDADLTTSAIVYFESWTVQPYLRPMSSMTEEERAEMKAITCPNGTGYFQEQYLVCPINHFGNQISFDFMADILDWLLEHHFDFRGLIEKGLALEAPEGMYEKGGSK